MIEVAARCNACISRTETALRGLKKTLSLKSEAALEWIADKAKKFSNGVESRVDDFMYETLKVCVGSSAIARVVRFCEELADSAAILEHGHLGGPKLSCQTRSNRSSSFDPIPYDPYDRGAYIKAVIEKYGINTRATKFIYDASLDPANALGLTKELEKGKISRIGPGAFLVGTTELEREATVANTVAHELVHARNYLRGLRGIVDEPQAILSGEMLETYIICR